MLFDWAVHGYLGAALTEKNIFLAIKKFTTFTNALKNWLCSVKQLLEVEHADEMHIEITELRLDWLHLSLLTFVRLMERKKKKSTTTLVFVKENHSARNVQRKIECTFIIFYRFGCGLMGHGLTQGCQKQKSTTAATDQQMTWLCECTRTVMVIPRGWMC